MHKQPHLPRLPGPEQTQLWLSLPQLLGHCPGKPSSLLVPRGRGASAGTWRAWAQPSRVCVLPSAEEETLLCGLRAAALVLAWLWLSGQRQVLSKHPVHWAASPPPLATEESFLGCMGCSAGPASAGMAGRALPGSRDLAGRREPWGTSFCPLPSFRNNLSPSTSLPASIKSKPKTGRGSPKPPLDSLLLLAARTLTSLDFHFPLLAQTW